MTINAVSRHCKSVVTLTITDLDSNVYDWCTLTIA